MSGCHSISVSLVDESRRLLVLKVNGTLEHGNSNSFLRDARAIVDQHQHVSLALVKLDVKGVSYIDSSGIGAIVELYKYLSLHSIDMRLENIGPSVRKVMGLLGLERFLRVD